MIPPFEDLPPPAQVADIKQLGSPFYLEPETSAATPRPAEEGTEEMPEVYEPISHQEMDDLKRLMEKMEAALDTPANTDALAVCTKKRNRSLAVGSLGAFAVILLFVIGFVIWVSVPSAVIISLGIGGATLVTAGGVRAIFAEYERQQLLPGKQKRA